MRWFVEVSRVGESGLSEKYCVEAKQWQAALQEARKLRGDSGALSKFSIELLDDGYRAVDPSLKLRYLVNQAPGDALLTPINENTETNSVQSNGASGKHRVAASVAPTAFASVAPVSLTKPSPSGIPRPASHAAPRPSASMPPRPASTAPPRMLVVPDDPVPLAPIALTVERELAALAVVAPLPAFVVVRERREEPRAESPITYREVAYAVKPGTSREQIEALLWARYKNVAALIDERATGKFVQLAVFDHVFEKRPERPPLATFAWKDWRGSPVLAFPGFGEPPAGPMSQVPPSDALASMPPAATLAAPVSAASPVASVSFPPLSIAPTAAAVPGALSAPGSGSAPASGLLAAPPVATLVVVESAAAPPVAPISASPAAPVVVDAAVPLAAVPLAAVPLAAVPLVVAEPAAPPVVAAPVLEVNFDSTSLNSAPRKSSPEVERQSRPRIAVAGRRRAGEDLISELFELMHELHFMRDVAAGAEFVLSVLDEVLPCEGVLIHVFDINTNHFVVVRAKGPNAKNALLQRMPAQDPLAISVMRSPRAVTITDAVGDPRFGGTRWQTVGVVPKAALCAPVRQEGRYLGLIELVNPAGEAPFHSSELNALDYVCEQFAEFLSKKPIILAADVILARN